MKIKNDDNDKNNETKTITINIKKMKPIAITLIIVIIFFLLYLVYNHNRVEMIKDSVVMINTYDENNEQTSQGSGFCSFKANYIVTNYHVVEGAKSIKVLDDGSNEYDVNKIIVFNKSLDLAIIEIEGELSPLKLGNGKNIRVKQKITAIGSPSGELNTVSEGIISNVDEKNEIRITAPISHGSSGGVLLNSNNKVIGVTNAGYDDAQNLNFAINVELLKNLYSDYKAKEYDEIDNNSNPDLYVHNRATRLSIKNDNINYVANNFDDFWKYTNQYKIFDNEVNSWDDSAVLKKDYQQMSRDNQKKCANIYNELINKETCDCGDNCCILNVNDNEDIVDLMLDLDILTTSELAVFMVDKDRYNSYDSSIDFVNSLYLEAGQKCLLWVAYFVTPEEFNSHSNLKKQLFNYVNGLLLSANDKCNIYKQVGLNC